MSAENTQNSPAYPVSDGQELPKQYDHHAPQARWYPFWEEKGYFHSEPNPDKKPYTIVIPPPNVTGALHLGHALNNTLQDTLIRMKRMQGYETLWVPGTDHAGIATQAMVERRLLEEEGKTRHDLGRNGLIKRIWDWKASYEHRILGQLKALGCSCDWKRLRFTLDPVCAKAVRYTFFTFFQKGLIYRGKRLVNWDCMLQTAVSDDEVNYETVAGNFWYMKYPIINPQRDEPHFVTVATTRPETMLGDTAIAIHPDPEGEFRRIEADLLTMLDAASDHDRADISDKLKALRERCKTHLPLLIQLRDMAADGRCALLPLMGREIPLVLDTWAKPELGTGCVKITPAHDPNDYEVGIRCGLPMINIMRKDGTLNEHAGVYRGLSMLDARIRVVADMEKLGLLECVEDREIELAHSDRSKTPIEPFLNDQWFVRMDQLAESAMEAVNDGRVKITPSRYAKGYLDWLGEKRDWPVGRQLWWGHQIPIWYCRDASQEELKAAFAGRDDITWFWAQEDGPEGKGQWWICSRDEDLAPDAVPGHKLIQDEDVLDTWFSSALWPHSTLGWPDNTPELQYYYPTNVLITSRDIITLWVARMVLTGLQNCNDVPFHNVFIHPKILDKYGEGMSKSKGNGVDPVDVIEEYGADSLRFAMAWLTTDSQDVRLPVDFKCPHCGALVEQTKENRTCGSIKCGKCKQLFSTQWARTDEDKALPHGLVISERFEMARNFCNKLWNAARFVMMNLETSEVSGCESLTEADLCVEDRWILSRLNTVADSVTRSLDGFHYADAVRVLYDFTWDEFCSFYLEMLKYRLRSHDLKRAALRVLCYVLDAILRLLHPIIPFITEEIWQALGKVAPLRGLFTVAQSPESVMIAPWPQVNEWSDAHIEAQFAVFQDVLKAVREIRSRQGVAPRQELHFTVRCSPQVKVLLEPMRPYFASMAQALVQDWGPDVVMPSLSSNSTGSNWEVAVDLTGLIDVKAELEKSRNQREKLRGFVEGKRKKLENENFIRRAAPEVVQKERNSLSELEEQLAATEEAISRLEKAL